MLCAGNLDYWQPGDRQLPAHAVTFTSKLDTDLYALAKIKAYARSLCVSPDGSQFGAYCSDRHATLVHRALCSSLRRCMHCTAESGSAPTRSQTTPDENTKWLRGAACRTLQLTSARTVATQRYILLSSSLCCRRVRIWRFATGKLRRTYDESPEAAATLQREGPEALRLEPIDFGRRQACMLSPSLAPWPTHVLAPVTRPLLWSQHPDSPEGAAANYCWSGSLMHVAHRRV